MGINFKGAFDLHAPPTNTFAAAMTASAAPTNTTAPDGTIAA